jgi:hypothetical protein
MPADMHPYASRGEGDFSGLGDFGQINGDEISDEYSRTGDLSHPLSERIL